MDKEIWQKYYLPNFSGGVVCIVLLIAILFGGTSLVCTGINHIYERDTVVAEVASTETSTSSFQEYFSESPTISEFTTEAFVDDLRAKKAELEEYLNSNNLSDSERLAIANALSNLELAIRNVEIVMNEVD